ncbi:MAG: metal-dependent transcriptional regulator [Chloroflexota bacterium]|nr:metal-dependent transcriptional regulator [Chloroflexota bacterium]
MTERQNPPTATGTTMELPSSEPARITHAIEDYLKAAFRLSAEGGLVTTQRMAEELGISGPAVTNMVKRLHELRLVEHTRYQGIALTETGKRIAIEVVRHHRLLELYLAQSLGYQWDQVHAEAELLEHHVSDELEARMDSALGFPTVDPHGDPIPSREGLLAEVPDLRLTDIEAGERATVRRVSDRNPDQLRYLGELGLRPGTSIAVLEKLPFDGPIRIRISQADHVIGVSLASVINVERES